MVHQATVNERNGSSETGKQGLARDVGVFAIDVLTLAELQTQLLVADVREYSRRALVPGLVLLSGVALGLACFPLALVALALWLVQVWEISYAMGFLIAVVVGAICGALLCVVGWTQVRRRAAVLRRSQEELVRNLRWIKRVLERNRVSRSN